jgi:hypothetical protein
MIRRLRQIPALLAAAWCAAAPGVAAADLLDDLLKTGQTGFARDGWTPLETWRGKLDEDQTAAIKVRLPRGDYLIHGICDEDCGDLDLRVFAPNGGKLVEDVLDDDSPIVMFTLAAAGEITVRVDMAYCDIEPCAYAMRTYGK